MITSRGAGRCAIGVSVFVATGLCLMAWWSTAIGVLHTAWPSVRLAFSAALLRGLPIYAQPGDGVVMGNMYGPGAALFYAPALLPRSVTVQIVVGQCLSLLAVTLPIGVGIAREAKRAGTDWIWAGIVWLVALLVLLSQYSTLYNLTYIHADAPCIGFGMASTLLLAYTQRLTPLRCVGAVGLLALAVLTKQNAAFVAVAHGLLILARFGGRAALRYALATVGWFALIMALFVLSTPNTLEAIFFEVITIPRAQKVRWNEPLVLHDSLARLVPLVVGCGVVAALAPGVRFRESLGGPTSSRRLVDSPSLQFLFVSLVLLPISLAGALKVGGYDNSFHAHAYAVAAMALALVGLAKAEPLRSMPVQGLSLAFVVWAFVPWHLVVRGAYATRLRPNVHETVLAYLEQHPDAYFPWHPLAHVEAQGVSFHVADGLTSWSLSGQPTSRQQFLSGVPARPSLVAWPVNDRTILVGQAERILRARYPFCRRVKNPPGLRGFVGLDCRSL